MTGSNRKTTQAPRFRERSAARRAFLPLGRAARRRLTHVLLAALLAALYGGLVYLLSRLAGGFLRPDNPLALALLALLAAGLAGPLYHALLHRVDRALHQEQADFRQAVQDLGTSLAHVIDLPELSGLILEHIATTMDLETAALYLLEPFSGTYRLYRDQAGPAAASAPAFAETDRFIQSLRVAHGAIQRHDAPSNILSTLGPEELAAVDRLQAGVFLPLATQDRLVGFIALGERRAGEKYTAADVALLGALSDWAAVAIENARLFAERERRLTELAVLNEIGQAINSAHSLGETLETIYRETGRLMDTTNLYISLYNPQLEEVSFPLFIAEGQPAAVPTRHFGNGLTEHVLRTRQPLLIAERVEDHIRTLGLEVLGGRPAASWLGVPILRQDQAIGVLAIQTTRPDDPYDVEDMHILEAIANQAAIAIENAHLYEVTDQALAQQRQEITALSDFARALATVALDPAQVAEQTLERAVETLQAQAGALVYYDEGQESFVPLAQLHWPAGQPWQEAWHALLPDLFSAASGPVVFRSDDPAARVPAVEGAPVHMLCPLIREDTPLALLHLALPAEAAPDEARRHFLRYLADHAAIALENALLYKKQVQQGAALDRRARHLAEILHLSSAIRADLDLDQVLQFIARSLHDALGFGVVLVSVVDERDPRQLRRAAGAGLAADVLPQLAAERLPLELYETMMRPEVRVGHSYVLNPQEAAMRGEPEGGVVLPALPDRPAGHDPGTILTPLRGAADRLLGVLTVGRPADGRMPEQDTIEILEIIANQGAVAIENARLYQALREAYATQGESLERVAHEIQVPLATLSSYADLLDQEGGSAAPDTLPGLLQVLRSNIARLDALVHDLAEASRAEAGSLPLALAPLDARDVVRDSVAAIRPHAERKGLALTVDLPADPAPVLADRALLEQVLDKLLSNACKYTEAPGTIAVAIRTVASPQEPSGGGAPPGRLRGPATVITVQDTGIGIPRAEQERVFARFFRSDRPAVRQEAGSGLGLYLVRLLVERQGGQVWVESAPGQGSHFHVALPIAAAQYPIPNTRYPITDTQYPIADNR